MSTALASGVVADLLDARPNLSPDQVKAILAMSAYSAPGLTDVNGAGAGGLDLAAALATPAPVVDPAPDTWPAGQTHAWDMFSAALLAGDRAKADKWWNKLSPDGPVLGGSLLDATEPGGPLLDHRRLVGTLLERC